MPRLRLGRARAPVQRLDPHAPHQRPDVTPSGLAPLGSQKTAQHPRPRKGKLQMQPVDLAHEFEIGRRRRARQVIHGAARKARSLGLFRDASTHDRGRSSLCAQQSRLGERAPARAGALEEGEGPVMGVEHHLLAFARINFEQTACGYGTAAYGRTSPPSSRRLSQRSRGSSRTGRLRRARKSAEYRLAP